MGKRVGPIAGLSIGTGFTGLMMPFETRANVNGQGFAERPWGELNGVRISGYPEKVLPGLDEPMARLYAETGMVGHVCARAYEGRLLFTRAYGWAYKGEPEETVPTPQWIPMTTTRSNPVGSCSKSLTAVAVLRQIEKGTISLDTKVIDYLGIEPILEAPEHAEFDPLWKESRIRHLLSHTSGVPEVTRASLIPKALLAEQTKANEVELVNGDQVGMLDGIRFLARFPLQFRPGEKYQYGIGFELLAAVLEKASGMRCDQCIEDTVFRPLGLTSATTWAYAGSRVNYEKYSKEHRFYGYGFNEEKKAYEWAYGDVVLGNSRKVNGWLIGGGFWCLSTVDAIRFITFWPSLLRNPLLCTAAVTDQTPDNRNYGFGFCNLRRRQHEPLTWRHNGSLGGIKADMRFDAGTGMSGAELWSSDHPRRKESVQIADGFARTCIENQRRYQVDDLWPVYGFTKGLPLYAKLYRNANAVSVLDRIPVASLKPPMGQTKREPNPQPKRKQDYRIWTDTTGKFKTEARFGGVIAGKVNLIRKDGSRIQVPLDRLSSQDVNWIRER